MKKLVKNTLIVEVGKSQTWGASESNFSHLNDNLTLYICRYLNYPTIQYVGNVPEHDKLLVSQRQLLRKAYPCDHHLFNLRTLPEKMAPTTPSSQALLILHSQTPDCSLGGSRPLTGCVTSSDLVFKSENYLDFGNGVKAQHFSRTSLTGNRVDSVEDVDKVFNIEPMTLETVKISFWTKA